MPVWSTFGAMSRLGFSNPSPPLPLTPGVSTYLDAATPTSYGGTGSTINDLTGSGNNGTIIGGVTYTGTAGGSWFLDGRSGFIRVGPVLGLGSATESYSMSIWVAPMTQVGNVINMSGAEPPDSWRTPPIICDQQTFRAKVWNNTLFQSSIYTIGTWYYVTTVWDYTNGQQRFYVNGSLVSSQSGVSYSSSGLANFLRLGGNAGGGSGNAGWWRGYVGAFHHYRNKALSDAEVLFNYNATSSRFASAAASPIVSTTLGLYLDTNRIGSATGTTTWTDVSGNSLNMTGPTATQLTVRPLGADSAFQNQGLISPGGLTSNGGSGGGYWVTGNTTILDDDTHSIMMWVKFNSTTAWPNGWNNSWEKFFTHNSFGSGCCCGCERSPSGWRWPTYRYIHWRYDPNNTSADMGPNSVSPTGTASDNPAQPNYVLDTWYHVGWVKNGGVIRQFVNGSYIGGNSVIANPKLSVTNPIGLFEGYTGASMQIDGLMVYDRVLSDAEVLQNYNALRGPYRQHPTADRLIFEIDASNPASYPGTGTSTFEISGRQLTGTMANVTYNSTATNYVGTGVGGSWVFNGSTSFISFPYDSIHDVAGSGVTAEVWVKPANFSQNGFFIEKGQVNSQYSLFIAGAALLWRTVTSVNGLSDINVNPNSYMNTTEWHHVVGTYSSGNKKLYINGVLIQTQTGVTGTINNNGNGIWLGKHAIPDSFFYNGEIGEARIYNRQLSDAEVLFNYNNTKGRYAKASLPAPATITVTGGTLTSDATYYYRTFTTNDNLVPSGTLTADVFVVAGGGAGGSSAGGGGGAGGLIIHPNASIPAGTYAVAIGAGGTNTVVNGNGNPGANTTIGAIYTAYGGGRGTSWGGGNGAIHDGGSSGGSGAQSGTTGGSNPTRGTSTLAGWTALGNAGGNGNGSSAGGGGGSDGAGVTGNWGAGRAATYGGGPGLTYAQGGQPGSTGGASVPAARTANSGSGGGSGGDNRQGANGASGIVIVRYTRSQITGG